MLAAEKGKLTRMTKNGEECETRRTRREFEERGHSKHRKQPRPHVGCLKRDLLLVSIGPTQEHRQFSDT